MAQHDHWFFCYITSWLLCLICFPLGVPGPIFFPWASSALFLTLHSHGLLLSSLGFPGPITSSPILWACHQPLTFFTFITLDLPWPILIFPHHILFMVCFSFFPGSFKPIYLLKIHLFISWTYDPLFLPLGLNGFSIYLPTLSYPCCWATPSHLGFKMAINTFMWEEWIIHRMHCIISKSV